MSSAEQKHPEEITNRPIYMVLQRLDLAALATLLISLVHLSTDFASAKTAFC